MTVGISEQTNQVVRNNIAMGADCRLALDIMVNVEIFPIDINHFQESNEHPNCLFGTGNYPFRVIVDQVAVPIASLIVSPVPPRMIVL